MNVDDVNLVLHHHWALDTSAFPDERQRLQLAFIILLCAYTASRPGALVYVKRNNKVLTKCALGSDDDVGDRIDLEPNEIIETLCYKHITLVLLPNPDGERDILAMEVDLQFTRATRETTNGT